MSAETEFVYKVSYSVVIFSITQTYFTTKHLIKKKLSLCVSSQSTRVVSFSPAPTGENGQSDLISIIKRFGEPLYTLFLPSMVSYTTLFWYCSGTDPTHCGEVNNQHANMRL